MFKKILVVIDEMPVSQAAIQLAHTLAVVHAADVVHLALMPSFASALTDATSYSITVADDIHTAATTQARETLDRAMADAERAGVMVRAALIQLDGDAHTVVEVARQRRCDVIVVATENQNAVVRLLSRNLVPGLITASPVPVLVCKPTDQASAPTP